MDGQSATASELQPPVNREPKFVLSFAALLGFQCIGEVIVRVTHAPIPGPVIGMVLFLWALCAAPALTRPLEDVSLGLLNHLALLFVPAGVGVMAFASEIRGELVGIAVAIVVSTAFSIAVAALVTGSLLVRLERKQRHLAARKATQS